MGRARLVATTLTGFRLHRDVAAGRYDTVVADDVGGSPLAEIILPVAAARRTAVLLGDAADVGPEQPAGEEAPEVRRWLLGTCFGHRGAACAGR